MPSKQINLNIKHNIGFDSVSLKSNRFNILYLNIRSLRNKIYELESLINSNKFQIHAIVLTETWLEDGEAKFFNFPNFKSFHLTRSKRGGGVAIFVKVDHEASLVLEKFFR